MNSFGKETVIMVKKALRAYLLIFIISIAAVHTVSAETGINASVDNKTGNVTISGCFDGKPDTPAGVYVLQSNMDSLEGITPSNAGDYINHIEQVYTDENGEFSFSYILDETEGKYAVHAAVFDGTETADTYFVYITNETIEECIKKAEENRDPSDSGKNLAQRAAALKSVFESEYILNAFDIFEASLPMGVDFDYIDDEVFEYMASVEYPYTEKNDIKRALEESIAVKLFNHAEDFTGVIEECREYFGLSEKLYNAYVSSKDAVNEMLANYSPASAAQAGEDITECVTLYKYRKMTHYTEFMRFVDEVDNAMGLDLDLYKTIKAPHNASNVDKAMLTCKQNIKSLAELRAEFTAQIKAELAKQTSNTAPSSGGGGGASSSSGVTMRSAVTENTNIAAEAKTEVFNDLEGVLWARESIISLAERGIVSGYGDGTYRPNSLIKREEAIKIIVAAFGIYDKTAVCDFKDVEQNGWYATYVASAYNRGMVSGIGDNCFGTGVNISRQDMALIVYNALKMVGVSYDKNEGQDLFADESAVADYAKEAVRALHGMGVINGNDENRFNPADKLTRAEMAKMMSAVLGITDGI